MIYVATDANGGALQEDHISWPARRSSRPISPPHSHPPGKPIVRQTKLPEADARARGRTSAPH